ncbi:hypothetical protein NDU88_001242 [Pleurodeles waltl]|uniref:Uncharacterized protein n=1 Tax=Pleurodeles waltl TaxID=8319 RepID=A0AAV7TH85_PLEWA|nr:hypothetical protein NDU88_001242 [Pleurodeles waltl]
MSPFHREERSQCTSRHQSSEPALGVGYRIPALHSLRQTDHAYVASTRGLSAPHHTRSAPLGRAHRRPSSSPSLLPAGGGGGSGLHRRSSPHPCPKPSAAGATSRLSPLQRRIRRTGLGALLARVRHARRLSHAPPEVNVFCEEN